MKRYLSILLTLIAISLYSCDAVLQSFFGLYAESVQFEKFTYYSNYESVKDATYKQGDRVFLRINGLSGLYTNREDMAAIKMHLKIENDKKKQVFELDNALNDSLVHSPKGRIEAMSAFYDIPKDLSPGKYSFVVIISDLMTGEELWLNEEFTVE